MTIPSGVFTLGETNQQGSRTVNVADKLFPLLSIGQSIVDVTKSPIVIFQNVASQNVTNFVGGQAGQVIHLVGDGHTTLVNGTSIKTNTGSNKTLAANRFYSFLLVGSVWMEHE